MSSERTLIGAIASNPGRFDGPGEYRYSITQQTIYFSSSTNPDTNDQAEWFPLPALNPDGTKRLETAFQRFIKRRWKPSRQAELERFAQMRGWDMAMELTYGGGALSDAEAAEWQYVVNRELERLAQDVQERITTLTK